MARGRDIELEQFIQAQLAEERALKLAAIQAEIAAKEKAASARLFAETWSCWCGMSHEDNKRLTESRGRPPAVVNFGTPNPRLFVGWLSYNIHQDEVAQLVVNILRMQNMDTGGMSFVPHTALDYVRECCSFDNEAYDPGTAQRFLGSLTIVCRDLIQAQSVASELHGHQTFRRGRNYQRLSMRVSYWRPKQQSTDAVVA